MGTSCRLSIVVSPLIKMCSVTPFILLVSEMLFFRANYHAYILYTQTAINISHTHVIVWTNGFVAPELLGRNYANVTRTEGNENFAVAIFFTLMMQDKQPYAHQGSSQSAWHYI